MTHAEFGFYFFGTCVLIMTLIELYYQRVERRKRERRERDYPGYMHHTP